MMNLRPQMKAPESLAGFSGVKKIIDVLIDVGHSGIVAKKIKAAIVALALHGWLSYPLANWLVSFLRLRGA